MNDIKQIIFDKIKAYNKIICLRHVSPDGDAYGSAFGLAQFIKDNFPTKKVLIDGKPLAYLDFLATPDQLEGKDYQDALVIITDTANTERIDSEFWQLGKEIIKIDHHPNVTPYGNIQWVDEQRIAASEMVGEFILWTKLEITPATARLVYTGIVTDSNRFMYNKTGTRTLEIAAKLLAVGIDVQEIYHNLYDETWGNVKFKSFLLANTEITTNGVGYIKISEQLLKDHKMSYEVVKPWVNIMSSIREFKIWVLFIENKSENYINISMRSSYYKVNKVAEKYHGGGHQLASGAKIYNWDEMVNVLDDLNKLIENNIII